MSNFEQHQLAPGDAVPFFISAGVLREAAQAERFLHAPDPLTVPLLTFGSFTYDYWPGNAKAGEQDFVYYADRQMAGNARGLPNSGREGVLALKEPIRKLSELGIKTLINITNLPHETPLDVIPQLAEIAAEVQPTGIEINLSCPNGKKADGSLHPPLSNNPGACGELIMAVLNRIGGDTLVGVKDSPHVNSLDDEMDVATINELADAFAVKSIFPDVPPTASLINFVTGINTIGNQPFPEIACTGGRGGMSGPIVAPIARLHQQIWQEAAPYLPYLSTGGIDSANADTEIPERLAAGALRVGGAQEFYRATQMQQLIGRWAQGL